MFLLDQSLSRLVRHVSSRPTFRLCIPRQLNSNCSADQSLAVASKFEKRLLSGGGSKSRSLASFSTVGNEVNGVRCSIL